MFTIEAKSIDVTRLIDPLPPDGQQTIQQIIQQTIQQPPLQLPQQGCLFFRPNLGRKNNN